MTTALQQLFRSSKLSNAWVQDVQLREYQTLEQPALSPELMSQAVEAVTAWPGYVATPTHSLNELASLCGVNSVLYKDESNRFGLGSFKALGGAFAILQWAAATLSEQLGKTVTIEDVRTGQYKEQTQHLTVATATDGNHGRSVAWGAQLAGCPCHIFIHRDVSVGREQAMAEFGADVKRIDGDYDESVKQCAVESDTHGWQIISDTSWPGYIDIPRSVMAGYTVMVHEMLQQLDAPPTHVIVQAGVGGLAAGVISAWWQACGSNAPRFIIVESDRADCVYASLSTQTLTAVEIKSETVMAGLSCGEVSQLAWPVLQPSVSASVTVPDDLVPLAMQCFAHGLMNGSRIEAGECSVPGVLALAAIMQDDSLAQQLALNTQSRVQIFGCEGATDPIIYEQLLATATA